MERIIKPKFFYGWVVAISGFLMQMGTVWSPSTFSVLLTPLESAFGWSRTQISVLASWSSLGYGASAYPGAWLCDKYGARLPTLMAAVLAGVSLYLMSRATTYSQLSLLYVTSGLTGLIFAVGHSVVQRWFREKRGLALGIVAAGGAEGGLMYPILVRWVVDKYSWSEGYLLMGGLVFILFLLSAFLMVDKPEKMGTRPYGLHDGRAAGDSKAAAARRQSLDLPTWTVTEALKTRALFLLLATNFLTIIPGFMLSVHLVPFAEGIGISRAVAAAAQGARGVTGIIGSMAGGALADVLGWKRGLVIFTFLGGLAIFWLLFMRNAWMLWVFVIVFGILQAARQPLMSGITGTYYGTKFLTQLIALNRISSMMGTAIGPVIGGFIYDKTGSYTVAFMIGAGIWLVAAVAMLAINQPHKKADAVSQAGAPA